MFAQRMLMPDIRSIQITSQIAIAATTIYRIHCRAVFGSVRFSMQISLCRRDNNANLRPSCQGGRRATGAVAGRICAPMPVAFGIGNDKQGADDTRERSISPTTLRGRPAGSVRASMRGIAQRAERRPLDLVHLPSAPRLGAQSDVDDIRNLLTSRGGGVFAAFKALELSGRDRISEATVSWNPGFCER